jgi:ribosomal protein S18 acetylase RimI-like enzyme
MKTRYANSDDIAALVRLINEAYRVEDFFVYGDRTSHEDVTARLGAPHACFIVVDGAIRGELTGAVWAEARAHRGHFAMLSVDPAYQGRGLGRALVGAVENHCLAAGCRALDLEVVDLRTELPSFYEKLGFSFVETARFPDPGKLRRDAHLIVMTKGLDVRTANGRRQPTT